MDMFRGLIVATLVTAIVALIVALLVLLDLDLRKKGPEMLGPKPPSSAWDAPP